MDTISKKTLGKNFFFNFFSQILTLIVPLITAPYTARVLLETGNGQVSYATSIITYFTLFANLGFDIYGQRQIATHKEEKEEQSKIFWEVFFLKILFTCISLIVLYSIVFSVGFGEKYNTLILILSVNVISVPLDIQFLFKGLEKFKLIAIRTTLIKLINLVCIFLFVKDQDDLLIYVLITVLSTLFSNLIMWTSIKKLINFVPIKKLSFIKHIKPAILIFIPTLVITIYTVFDKTMIGLLSTNPDYDNGCYEKAYTLNNVMFMLITFVSSVMISKNSDSYAKGGLESVGKNISEFSIYWVYLIGIPLTIGCFILAPNLSSWFLGDGYDEVPTLLRIMSIRFIVAGFAEIFCSQFFIVIGKEKYCFISTLCSAVLNVSLNAILIPSYGAIGAAVATAACELLNFLISSFIVWKMHVLSIKKLVVTSIKYIIAGAIMFVPIYFMNKYLAHSIWSFILITFVGALVYFISLIFLKDKFVYKGLHSIKEKIIKKELKKQVNKKFVK